MQAGLAISLLFHAALLAWAILTIQSTPELRPDDTPPISVAIITASELTRMKQGDENTKQLEAKASDQPNPDLSKQEAPKPKPPTAPPPPAPEPPAPPEPPKPEPPKVEQKPDPIAEQLAATQPPPEPAPGPTPEEQRALEDKIKAEQKKADDQKRAEEKKKADEKKKLEDQKKREQEKKLAEARKKAEEAKKKQFDADRIAALIDKSPDKRGAPQAAAASPNPAAKTTGPTAGTKDGKDTVLSAREEDLLKNMLKSQLASCWRLPGGGGGIETTVVTLKWRMKPDGTLDGDPQVLRPQATPVFSIAAEAAVRAVKQCQPFKLPADLYEKAWRNIEWEFDPRQLI